MGKDMTRLMKRKPLREVLIEQGLVAGPQLDAVLGKLEDGRRPLGQALVAEGLLSAEQLGRALLDIREEPLDLLPSLRCQGCLLCHDTAHTGDLQTGALTPITQNPAGT